MLRGGQSKRAEFKEISEAEGQALIAAGRAKVVDAEPLFKLRFVPLWKAPKLYLSLLVPLVVAGVIIALNAIVGLPKWPVDEEAMSFWPALAHVLVVPAPSGPKRRSRPQEQGTTRGDPD